MLRFFTAAAIALSFASAGWAEGPKPFPKFEAKRVKPPAPGTKKRITVQIAPKPVVTTPGTGQTALADPGDGSVGQFGWFWDSVSPKLSASGPGRLEPALIRIANAPQGQGVAAPRLQLMQDIVAAHGPDILLATIGTRVSPALVLAVIAVESSGRTEVVSTAGAQGLMQLMPATAERFGVTDRADPKDNIGGGVRFLDFLMGAFEDDPILVLAGYNAGENAISAHDGVPAYPETRDYVPKVLAAFKVARQMCVTAPELVSDGCVFRKPGT